MMRTLITKEELISRYNKAKKLSGVRGEILLRNIEVRPGTNLSGINLEGAVMHNVGLAGTNLKLANLAGVNFEKSDLSMADLRGADMAGANLKYASLKFAKMAGTDISGADCSHAEMYGVQMNKDTILDGAEMIATDMRRALLSGTDTSEARIIGCRTEGIKQIKPRMASSEVNPKPAAPLETSPLEKDVPVRLRIREKVHA